MFDKIKSVFTKKTVHSIESICYLLGLIIVVIANVFGPIQIRMIPLLFFLGCIGNIVFKRPIITTLFSSIVSVCVLYISGVTNLFENALASGIFSLYVALGELFGGKIKIASSYWLKRKKKSEQYYKNMIFSVVIAFICIGFHNYTDSNIFMYNDCKSRLNSYLGSNYDGEDFEILYASYNFNGEKNFRFNVLNIKDENVYNFIVYTNKKLEIYDGIKDGIDRKDKKREQSKIDNILKENEIDLKCVVDKINESYELNLEESVEKIDKENLTRFSKKVAMLLNKILENNDDVEIEQVNLAINDLEDSTQNIVATVYVNGYIKNMEEGIQKDYSYIMKALSIEYID